jgi:hypothetical protein
MKLIYKPDRKLYLIEGELPPFPDTSTIEGFRKLAPRHEFAKHLIDCAVEVTNQEEVRRFIWDRYPVNINPFCDFELTSGEIYSLPDDKFVYEVKDGKLCVYPLLEQRATLIEAFKPWRDDGERISPRQAKVILKIRDELAREDISEAYHQLYELIDPKFERLDPWEEIKKIAAHPF